MTTTKDYRGGVIFPGDRVIVAGEQVRVNTDGRIGVVRDRHEGSYVFSYLVEFPGDPALHRFGTDRITPVVNP